MTYRILTITYERTAPEKFGWQNAVLKQAWGTETWYQAEPGEDLVYAIPPWGMFYLWEIDAPFPAPANPPSPPFPTFEYIVLNYDIGNVVQSIIIVGSISEWHGLIFPGTLPNFPDKSEWPKSIDDWQKP